MSDNVPRCGASDKRNVEYEASYTPQKFFSQIVSSDAPVIFDIGAHQGESISYFSSIFGNATIYSFEPHPANFEQLRKRADGNRVKAFNLAVGDTVGAVKFYAQDVSHLGGLLPINTGSEDSLGFAATARNQVIEVQCSTLDDLLPELGVQRIDVLKIDVQGFELKVLKGAGNVLHLVGVIMIELSLYDFYEEIGDSWFQVNALLGAHGFKVWDIAKVSKNPRNLRTDWVELVYVRK